MIYKHKLVAAQRGAFVSVPAHPHPDIERVAAPETFSEISLLNELPPPRDQYGKKFGPSLSRDGQGQLSTVTVSMAAMVWVGRIISPCTFHMFFSKMFPPANVL